MKKTAWCALMLLAVPLTAGAELNWTPLLQQTGLYYISDRVTLAGFGLGLGARLVWEKNFVAEADAGLLWGNGTVVPTRLAVGYQLDGAWSPAVYGTFGLLWGQRIEVLSDTGQRPAAPIWVAGLRIAPLRFSQAGCFASALEFGYGFGPDRGVGFEVTLLSVGGSW